MTEETSRIETSQSTDWFLYDSDLRYECLKDGAFCKNSFTNSIILDI